jgi:hypothetical protein
MRDNSEVDRALRRAMLPLTSTAERSMHLAQSTVARESCLMSGKLSILKEFWSFLRIRKKWWLAPVIVLLLTLGLILVLTEGSALAPFIYSLF